MDPRDKAVVELLPAMDLREEAVVVSPMHLRQEAVVVSLRGCHA